MALTKEDLQAIRTLMQEELRPVNERLDNLETGQRELCEGLRAVRDSQFRVELEQYPRIAAALDGVIAADEKSEAQGKRVSALEDKTADHDKRIYALEYAQAK